MKAKRTIINDIELLYIKNSNPNTFHLEFNFNAGYNHSQKSQVPHILEHLFATFPKETSEKFLRFGAYSNANTFYERTRFFITSPKEFSKECFDILVNSISKIPSSQEDFEIQKKIVETEITNKSIKPSIQIFEKALKETFPDIKDKEKHLSELKSINLTDIQEFYRKNYVKNNLRIIICADFSDTELEYFIKEIDKINLPSGKAPTINLLTINQKDFSTLHNSKTVDEICKIFHTNQPLTEKERAAFHILMSYLFRPKIGKAFLRGRNTGILYGINFSPHLNTIRNHPFFVIGSKIKPENKNKLKKIINEEFSKVKNNKIDVQAFEVIKQNIKNSEKITRESTERIVNFYREEFFTYGKVRDYQESLDILDKISTADLIHVAKKFNF
ncbi:MAG: insulinase family protein [Candidatus Nanogingivalaceae bacterium]|nr:MAG: insulinase family protein [Candidatus Nanogingivalaceae bacterium]QWB91451.1 MAG: insulinase family protein [Candidatus Nanogingivalaceae bacterium]